MRIAGINSTHISVPIAEYGAGVGSRSDHA